MDTIHIKIDDEYIPTEIYRLSVYDRNDNITLLDVYGTESVLDAILESLQEGRWSNIEEYLYHTPDADGNYKYFYNKCEFSAGLLRATEVKTSGVVFPKLRKHHDEDK